MIANGHRSNEARLRAIHAFLLRFQVSWASLLDYLLD